MLTPDATPDHAAGRGCRTAAAVAACLLQAALVLICFGAMYLGMKTNGQVFTETLEQTRRETWLAGATVAGLVTAVPLAYALAKRRPGLLAFETAVLAVVIVLGVYFHHLIPVPPGTYSSGIPGP